MKLLERLGVAWGVFNLGLPEEYAPQRLLGKVSSSKPGGEAAAAAGVVRGRRLS